MSKLSERITALHQQRAAKVTSLEALLSAVLDADRDLSDEEKTTREALRSEITRIDADLDRCEADQLLLAARALPVTTAVPSSSPASVPAQPSGIERDGRGKIICTGIPVIDEFEGAGFTRMAIAIAVAGEANAAAYAEHRWGNRDFANLLREYQWRSRVGDGLTLRAATPPMNSGEALGAGGSTALIIIQNVASQFIEMLRPNLIVDRLPARTQINFGGAGRLLIPKQTGGVTGAYIGEGNSIIVQRLTFDQIALTPSKLAVIVPTTNELLRRSDPSIEALIRNDMIAGTARTIDGAFMASATNPPAPDGLLTYNTSLAAGNIPASATVTQVSDALRAMIMAARSANLPLTRPAWIMNPRLVEYLRLLRTTTTEQFAFKTEIDGGTLMGYPIVDSTNVLINPGDDAAPYALVDAAQVIWADDMAPVIDASEEATIQSNSAPDTPPSAPYVSAFQQDMTLMRIRMSHSWSVRYNESVIWALDYA